MSINQGGADNDSVEGGIFNLEETLQASTNKLPTYDLYISYNTDGTVNQKMWKTAGTSTVIKTLMYNYSGGNLISKILS